MYEKLTENQKLTEKKLRKILKSEKSEFGRKKFRKHFAKN